MSDRSVVPSISEVAEEKFHAAMMLGIMRLTVAHGRDKVAHALGVSPRQIGNLANGSFPAAHRFWNLLALDATAMDEVAALYRAEVRTRTAIAADDMDTVARITRLAGQWIDVMADGVRDHRETLELADAIRPLVQRLNSVCAQADRLKGVAA